ncbi:hypothetical protein Srubr_19840 [Streptomyces rubradiris]|uniref:AMP-dependent synthetase/ligase domain-containing protein n=1 Tax=Streptomyces rubradiris TaxID=285531 RepID=A0ABQ3R8G6_STRRR|nr:hypothetical protein GCM10018792_59580 [Streptomyces rubradiris]GHI52138.1 hypothetical protein Srubr_19840 [Streptomyces rubradiris]
MPGDFELRYRRHTLLAADIPAVPVRRTVPELFEAQVRRTPGACSHAEGVLTYRELDARANRLARHLTALGAGPEQIVAVALPRGLDLPVALLAILKAGAVYLPLDLAHPDARFRAVLADADPEVVLTHTVALPRLAHRGTTVAADDPATLRTLSALPDDPPGHRPDPTTLAYVIYTSGSTGTPKGVAMPHRGLANLLAWHRDRFPGRPGTRVGQFTALGFDF